MKQFSALSFLATAIGVKLPEPEPGIILIQQNQSPIELKLKALTEIADRSRNDAKGQAKAKSDARSDIKDRVLQTANWYGDEDYAPSGIDEFANWTEEDWDNWMYE